MNDPSSGSRSRVVFATPRSRAKHREPSPTLTLTGRMWGYTDELTWVERSVVKTVEAGRREILALGVTPRLDFVVTRRTVVGSRGFFTKRYVSQFEYEITGNRKQCLAVKEHIDVLVARIS